jgi:hypothetical protein
MPGSTAASIEARTLHPLLLGRDDFKGILDPRVETVEAGKLGDVLGGLSSSPIAHGSVDPALSPPAHDFVPVADSHKKIASPRTGGRQGRASSAPPVEEPFFDAVEIAQRTVKQKTDFLRDAAEEATRGQGASVAKAAGRAAKDVMDDEGWAEINLNTNDAKRIRDLLPMDAMEVFLAAGSHVEKTPAHTPLPTRKTNDARMEKISAKLFILNGGDTDSDEAAQVSKQLAAMRAVMETSAKVNIRAQAVAAAATVEALVGLHRRRSLQDIIRQGVSVGVHVVWIVVDAVHRGFDTDVAAALLASLRDPEEVPTEHDLRRVEDTHYLATGKRKDPDYRCVFVDAKARSSSADVHPASLGLVDTDTPADSLSFTMLPLHMNKPIKGLDSVYLYGDLARFACYGTTDIFNYVMKSALRPTQELKARKGLVGLVNAVTREPDKWKWKKIHNPIRRPGAVVRGGAARKLDTALEPDYLSETDVLAVTESMVALTFVRIVEELKNMNKPERAAIFDMCDKPAETSRDVLRGVISLLPQGLEKKTELLFGGGGGATKEKKGDAETGPAAALAFLRELLDPKEDVDDLYRSLSDLSSTLHPYHKGIYNWPFKHHLAPLYDSMARARKKVGRSLHRGYRNAVSGAQYLMRIFKNGFIVASLLRPILCCLYVARYSQDAVVGGSNMDWAVAAFGRLLTRVGVEVAAMWHWVRDVASGEAGLWKVLVALFTSMRDAFAALVPNSAENAAQAIEYAKWEGIVETFKKIGLAVASFFPTTLFFAGPAAGGLSFYQDFVATLKKAYALSAAITWPAELAYTAMRGASTLMQQVLSPWGVNRTLDFTPNVGILAFLFLWVAKPETVAQYLTVFVCTRVLVFDSQYCVAVSKSMKAVVGVIKYAMSMLSVASMLRESSIILEPLYGAAMQHEGRAEDLMNMVEILCIGSTGPEDPWKKRDQEGAPPTFVSVVKKSTAGLHSRFGTDAEPQPNAANYVRAAMDMGNAVLPRSPPPMPFSQGLA